VSPARRRTGCVAARKKGLRAPSAASLPPRVKTKDLRELLHRLPFVPFTLRMDSGAGYLVPHPDYLLLVPGGEHAVVAELDGRFHILDVEHISGVTVQKPARRRAAPGS